MLVCMASKLPAQCGPILINCFAHFVTPRGSIRSFATPFRLRFSLMWVKVAVAGLYLFSGRCFVWASVGVEGEGIYFAFAKEPVY